MRDNCLGGFFTLLAQPRVLGFAPTTQCPTRIALLAAVELLEIWNINVILEKSMSII